MPYTDQQIKDYAMALDAKGAPAAEIEAFVSGAKAEQGSVAPITPPARQPGNARALIPAPPIAIGANDNPLTQFAKQMGNVGYQGIGAVGNWLGANKGRVADIAVQGGLPAVGQRFGGPVGGAIGGVLGDALTQGRQMMNNERPNFSPGEMVGAGVAGAIPMKSMKGAGVGPMARESIKMAAGNVAAEAVQTGIDQQRLPTPAEMAKAASAGALSVPIARSIDAGRLAQNERIRMGNASRTDETLLMAHQAGFLLDPELANPTAMNKVVTSVAGASKLQQAASKYNQTVVDALAKREIGIPDGQAITPAVLTTQAAMAAGPYRQLAGISPEAAGLVETWRTANKDAKDLWRAYSKTGLPAARKEAIAAQNTAKAAEDEMFDAALNAGKPGLVRDLKQARVELAKIHAVDAATNDATGAVDARVLGAMYANKAPLTGTLETIARLQQAMPQVMGNPAVSSGMMKAARGVGYASGTGIGLMAGGPMGAAAGTVAAFATPQMAKSAALSELYQKFMYSPRYATSDPDTIANIARFAAQATGR